MRNAFDTESGSFVSIESDSIDLDHREKMLRKLEILAGNTHPATQRLIGFCAVDGNRLQLVFDFRPNEHLDAGLIYHDFHLGTGLDATQKAKIIIGFLSGLADYHRRGIRRHFYQDAILLNDDFEPVIVDFEIFHGFLRRSNLTNLIFTPPEGFAPGDAALAGGVYFFAMIVSSLFSDASNLDKGSVSSEYSLLFMIPNGARPMRAPEIPDALWAVITRAWHQDPEMRPTFRQLLSEAQSDHFYILPGADVSAVLEYENRVTKECFGACSTDRVNRFKEAWNRSVFACPHLRPDENSDVDSE
jgi:serine/threonine protein kinase